MTAHPLPLRARLALLRVAELDALRAVYEADVAARGVAAVVAPHVAPWVPSQRRGQ